MSAKKSAGKYLIVCAMIAGLSPAFAGAPPSRQEYTLYSFRGGSNGNCPVSDLNADGSGNFYGTTESGGGGSCEHGCGTVFKLTPARREAVLYTFQGGSDGAYPHGGLVVDDAGNLYGTSGAGGSSNCNGGCGTVFELAPDGTETQLYVFQGGSDGAGPIGDLITDNNGNYFGTTSGGGNYGAAECEISGCGTVYELGSNGKETVLYGFQGNNDGALPQAGLVSDSSGNLYGTTAAGGVNCLGGSDGCGTVFKVAPNGTETIICAFQGSSDGRAPIGGLIMDGSGNLYGTTAGGGDCSITAAGCGTVFKIASDGTETVLYVFQGGNDGVGPMASLAADSTGNFYGTTYFGGGVYCKRGGCGTVFKLTPEGTETVLYSFKGQSGKYPAASLLLGSSGQLYGTATEGGKHEDGVVFGLPK